MIMDLIMVSSLEFILQLPGVELIHNCKLRYGKSSIYVLPLAINPSGCIRSEPKSRTFFKRLDSCYLEFLLECIVKNLLNMNTKGDSEQGPFKIMCSCMYNV